MNAADALQDENLDPDAVPTFEQLGRQRNRVRISLALCNDGEDGEVTSADVGRRGTALAGMELRLLANQAQLNQAIVGNALAPLMAEIRAVRGMLERMEARQLNSRAHRASSAIYPLPFVARLQRVPAFPATQRNLWFLTNERVTALLEAYGLEHEGMNLAEKREALAEYCHVPM
jgi:hypothetical protein